MDDISRLLRMARLDATLDKRCLLAASTRMEVDSMGEREVPFHVLLEGECRLEVEGTLITMRAGDVVVIPAGSSHRVVTEGAGVLRPTTERQGRTFALTSSEGGGHPVIDLFCGHYTVGAGAGAILFGSLPTPTHVSLFRSEGGRDLLTGLSSLMRSEASHDGAGSAAIMSAFCTVLMALVLRTPASSGANSLLWTAVSEPRMSEIVRLVLDDPGGDWSIDRLRRRSSMSRATFIRHFQAATGMTFGRFLARARLMTAADQLVGTDLSVAAIAAAVGFRSESAFARAFRAELGDTPARFRRSQAE